MSDRGQSKWLCRIGLHDFPDRGLARFPNDCLPCYRDCGKALQVGYDGMDIASRVVPIRGRVAQIIAARYGEKRLPKNVDGTTRVYPQATHSPDPRAVPSESSHEEEGR